MTMISAIKTKSPAAELYKVETELVDAVEEAEIEIQTQTQTEE